MSYYRYPRTRPKGVWKQIPIATNIFISPRGEMFSLTRSHPPKGRKSGQYTVYCLHGKNYTIEELVYMTYILDDTLPHGTTVITKDKEIGILPSNLELVPWYTARKGATARGTDLFLCVPVVYMYGKWVEDGDGVVFTAKEVAEYTGWSVGMINIKMRECNYTGVISMKGDLDDGLRYEAVPEGIRIPRKKRVGGGDRRDPIVLI